MTGTVAEWLSAHVDEYSKRRERYEAFARVLAAILAHAVSTVCQTATVQARAKATASFARKCARFYPSLRATSDPITELTDLCGARVIVQLQGQVDALARFVRQHFEVDERNSQDTVDRLQHDQFGYRSVHLVVKINAKTTQVAARLGPGALSENDGQLARELKAEIQLRTIAQHAWAEVSHDRIYKASFGIPASFQRRNAKIAAMIEQVDSSFADLTTSMDALYANVSAYRSIGETLEDIAQLRAVLPYDPLNASLAADLARRQISIDKFDDALETVGAFERHFAAAQGSTGQPLPTALLVCKGRAKLLEHLATPHGQAYKEGQQILIDAHKAAPDDIEAATALAESYVGVDRDRAFEWFELAFQLDPHDPVALGGYLRHRLADDRHTRILTLLRPSIEVAAHRCREQIAARVNLPHALFHLAEFELFLQPAGHLPLAHAYQGMYALCRAISLSEGRRALLHSLVDRFTLLSRVEHAPWLAWARQVLLLARSVEDGRLDGDLKTSRNGLSITTPILIVAGGCDSESAADVAKYRTSLEELLRDFRGTVICGGTREGISGLTGEICAAHRDRIRTIGYLPLELPADGSATRDAEHYAELRNSSGSGIFSPAEPIQSWIDLLASGVEPGRDVTLIGINGGDIAGFEYHLAAALGAKVAIVRDSGRRADVLMLKRDEPGNEKIYFFPDDPETFRAIIAYPPASEFEEADLLKIGEQIDQTYHEGEHQRKVEAWKAELQANARLAASFGRSNRMQAEHIVEKLRRIGKRAVKVNGTPRIHPLTDPEVALLAQMEHGRWVVDRTWEGWRLGPTRDNEKRERPQLVPWEELSQEERVKDIDTVRRIPEYLALLGREIVPAADAV